MARRAGRARRNIVTTLRHRQAAPMAAFDRLPPALRRWLQRAALPWSVASALRLWHRAMAETGCEADALARLDAAEARSIARDAARIWGRGHPAAAAGVRRPAP
ncbi:MAG: DUF6525 family protein [Gemmobacter sp.]